jgi:hypothetical protein
MVKECIYALCAPPWRERSSAPRALAA